MKNRFFLVLFILLFAGFGFGQTKEVDSLKTLLLKSQLNDSSEIDILIALTKAYIPVNIDSTDKFSKIG